MAVATTKILSVILIDVGKTILYFPVWWYSQGLLNVLKGGLNMIRDFEQTLGFFIWLKNLFVPMFGQRDISGRIISVFLRFFQIIVKGIILLIFSVLVFAFYLIWLVLPIFIIYQIIIHLF